SKKRGITKRCRLTIDVRRIYGRMGPDATLDDILNDPKCIFFEEDEASSAKEAHHTVVEIICDGQPEKVGNGYELNRLFPYTDLADEELRRMLIQNCPIPFSA